MNPFRIIFALVLLASLWGCQSSEAVNQDPGASGASAQSVSPDQKAALQQARPSKKGEREK